VPLPVAYYVARSMMTSFVDKPLANLDYYFVNHEIHATSADEATERLLTQTSESAELPLSPTIEKTKIIVDLTIE
jgi:hypothetical protein